LLKFFFCSLVPAWPTGPPDDDFRFALRFALKKVAIRGLRRVLVDAERDRIAGTIVDHLRLCGWRWFRPERSIEPGYMARMPRSNDDPSGGTGKTDE
jgi:hypothetical protein